MKLNVDVNSLPRKVDIDAAQEGTLAKGISYEKRFLACFPEDTDNNEYVLAWILRFLQDRSDSPDFSDRSDFAWLMRFTIKWSGWEINNVAVSTIRQYIHTLAFSEYCKLDGKTLEVELVDCILMGRGMRIHEEMQAFVTEYQKERAKLMMN